MATASKAKRKAERERRRKEHREARKARLAAEKFNTYRGFILSLNMKKNNKWANSVQCVAHTNPSDKSWGTNHHATIGIEGVDMTRKEAYLFIHRRGI